MDDERHQRDLDELIEVETTIRDRAVTEPERMPPLAERASTLTDRLHDDAVDDLEAELGDARRES
jgi:hypothetical protein